MSARESSGERAQSPFLGNVTSHTSDCDTLAEDPTTLTNGTAIAGVHRGPARVQEDRA